MHSGWVALALCVDLGRSLPISGPQLPHLNRSWIKCSLRSIRTWGASLQIPFSCGWKGAGEQLAGSLGEAHFSASSVRQGQEQCGPQRVPLRINEIMQVVHSAHARHTGSCCPRTHIQADQLAWAVLGQ